MAQKREVQKIKHHKKATSQGMSGRSRKIKASTKHRNKRKAKRKLKYRGQGR